MRVLSIPLLLAAFACHSKSEDADGDGYGVPQDCDDNDPKAHPDAEEVCDGADNDCDGEVDEDLGAIYYTDADGDGFGTGDATRACDNPTGVATVGGDCDDADASVHDVITWFYDADLDGYGGDTTQDGCASPGTDWMSQGGDCDDTNDTVHPGATEVCDGFDTDCDPTTTEDQSVDALTWYPDADADGHGAATGSILSCEAPATGSWSDLSDDCDDNDATSYPGNIELCDGGIDNDCDPGTDEALTATWYRDRDGDGYGDSTDMVNGCSPPQGYVQLRDDCDDTDPAINPLTTPNCQWDHCSLPNPNITASETWRPNVTHVVNCLINVQSLAQPVLTIEDGTVVQFGPGGGLVVGDSQPGSLVVQGDTQGVTFTSSVTPVPQAGDWWGVKIGQNDRVSSITGLTIQYAGANNEGGLWVAGSDVELDRVDASNNLGAGIYVSGNGAEPLIHDSTLTLNSVNGLKIDYNAGLSRADANATQGPSFTNNVVSYNGGSGISMPGSHADELDPSSTYSPNASDEIDLVGGTLRFTGTWYDHGIPYVVQANELIHVEDGPQALLNIQDGVTVKFNSNSGLRVGEAAEGAVVVEDGPAGVIFTATDDVKQRSDNWDGIVLGRYASNSVVRNSLVEYGGGLGTGSIYVDRSAPTITDTTVQLSDSDGIYVTGSGAAPLIQNSIIRDNDIHGVEVQTGADVARSVTGPTFANNQLVGNGQRPVLVPPSVVGQLDPSTQFSGNGDIIGIRGGDVTEDALWRKLDEDYEILGDVEVAGPRDPVLTIEDGNILSFDGGTKLRAGMTDDGALVTPGGVGVLMTSDNPVPGQGDWNGIEIGRNGSLAQQTDLTDLRIEYAGNSTTALGGAITLFDNDSCLTQEPLVHLTNIQIYQSAHTGLGMAQSSSVAIDGFHIDGAADGCMAVGGTSPNSSCDARVAQFDNFTCVNAPEFGSWPIKYADLLQNLTPVGPVSFYDSRLSQDMTLYDIGVPYIVHHDLTVGNVSVPVLTVADNVTVKFEPGAGLNIATSSTNGGISTGTNTVFTSANPVPAKGDWKGITLNFWCGPIDLRGATVDYAGSNGSGAVYFNTCTLTNGVSGNTIQNSSACGIYLNPRTLSDPPGNTFVNNNGGDICRP